MKQKVLSVFIVVVWGLVIFQGIYNQRVSQLQVKEAFIQSDVKKQKAVLTASVGITRKFETLEQKERYLAKKAEKLGITSDYTMQQTGENLKSVEFVKNGSYGKSELYLYDMTPKQVKTKTGDAFWLVAKITLENRIEGLSDVKDKVCRMFAEESTDYRIYIQYEGEKSQVMSKTEQMKTAQEWLKLMEAKYVDSVTLEDSVSVYGYRKKEKSFVENNGKKVNVNVAFSTDGEKTKIYAASPFILEEY